MPEVKSRIKIVSYIPLIVGIFFLCVFFSHSFVIGGAFFGVISGASLIVFFGGSKFLKFLETVRAVCNGSNVITRMKFYLLEGDFCCLV